MRNILLLATVIVFSTCNQSWAQNVGRWQLVPVIGPPIDVRGTPHYYAWRLDTATGALQMCSYDPGGWKRPEAPGGIVKEQLDCTTPIDASETNQSSAAGTQ